MALRTHLARAGIALGCLWLAACGMVTEIPETIADYPDEFGLYLVNNNQFEEYEDLVYYLASHRVDKVVPVWQLLQQGSDWAAHKLPRFAVPPRQQWPQMVNTLLFLKYELIPYTGPVKVLSGFRTPHYNQVAGGAGRSRHLSFSALDLRTVADVNRGQLHRFLLDQWKRVGQQHQLGLGLYSKLRFHVDTGGYRRW